MLQVTTQFNCMEAKLNSPFNYPTIWWQSCRMLNDLWPESITRTHRAKSQTINITIFNMHLCIHVHMALTYHRYEYDFVLTNIFFLLSHFCRSLFSWSVVVLVVESFNQKTHGHQILSSSTDRIYGTINNIKTIHTYYGQYLFFFIKFCCGHLHRVWMFFIRWYWR